VNEPLQARLSRVLDVDVCTQESCAYRTDDGIAQPGCWRHRHEIVNRRYVAVAAVVEALSGAGAFNCGAHHGYEYAHQLVRGEFDAA
jgi:hypothetical protein